MFQSLQILTYIFLLSGKCVGSLSVKLSVLEITFIIVSICVYYFSRSIKFIVDKVALVLIFSCLFVYTLTLFSPIIESPLIIRLLSKTLLSIPMRNIVPPLPSIMIQSQQVHQLPMSWRLAVTHLTFIWYAVAVYQPPLSIWYAVVEKPFIIRPVWKVHPSLAVRRHVPPLTFIYHSQRIDSSRLGGKAALVNGRIGLVWFHAIYSCLNFFV